MCVGAGPNGEKKFISGLSQRVPTRSSGRVEDKRRAKRVAEKIIIDLSGRMSWVGRMEQSEG